jgi:hypothetical protein
MNANDGSHILDAQTNSSVSEEIAAPRTAASVRGSEETAEPRSGLEPETCRLLHLYYVVGSKRLLPHLT